MTACSSDTPKASTILVIEDDDLKFKDLDQILRGHFNFIIQRATTVVDAEDQIDKGSAQLIVLDVSMNIARGGSGHSRGGHANLGGLVIAEKMFLEGTEKPTLIVTGFDIFQRGSRRHADEDVVDLTELEQTARKLLGSHLLGCIRYGAENWQSAFVETIEGWLK